MDMIERVARAITKGIPGNLAFCELQESDKPKFRRAVEADTKNALKDARAAIEAMMEPTEEMYQSGEMELGCHQIYQAMIRAALEEDK